MGEIVIKVQCCVLEVVVVENTQFARKDNEAEERKQTNALLSTQTPQHCC